MQLASRAERRPQAEEVSVRIASDRDDLFSAFELVYNAYLQTGLCDSNPYGLRVTGYQTLESTEVLVASVEEAIACTVSVVGDGHLGLPLESVYKNEVENRRAAGASLAEVSCLAQAHQGEGTFPIVVKLMTLVAQLGKRRGVDELLIAVHPRHGRFYQRFLGFQPMGPEKSYRAVRNNPAVAMKLDLNNLATFHPRGYQTLFGEPLPGSVTRYQPLAYQIRDEMQFLAAETTGHSITPTLAAAG